VTIEVVEVRTKLSDLTLQLGNLVVVYTVDSLQLGRVKPFLPLQRGGVRSVHARLPPDEDDNVRDQESTHAPARCGLQDRCEQRIHRSPPRLVPVWHTGARVEFITIIVTFVGTIKRSSIDQRPEDLKVVQHSGDDDDDEFVEPTQPPSWGDLVRRAHYTLLPTLYVDEHSSTGDLLWQQVLEQRAIRAWLIVACVVIPLLIVIATVTVAVIVGR
jgi:hypothetical protein